MYLMFKDMMMQIMFKMERTSLGRLVFSNILLVSPYIIF